MIRIIRARREDAEALTQITISGKAHWGYPEAWIKIWTPQLTITEEYIGVNPVWVLVKDQKTVAYYSLILEGEKVLLDNLFVLPSEMRQGYGEKLFNHALAQAKETGAKILWLKSDPFAQGFYEKMGMRKFGEHRSTIQDQARILPLMEIGL